MGYVTPIIFNNDALHEFEKDPEQVMEIISRSCCDHNEKTYSFHTKKSVEAKKWWQFWKKDNVHYGGICFSNYITGLGTFHSSNTRHLIFDGSAVIDLEEMCWNKDYLNGKDLDFYEKRINQLQRKVTEAKKIIKEKRE
jgi:hypothetical protein